MRELVYTVTAEYDGQSLQSFLRRGNGYSTRMLARIKQIDRGMTADGRPIRTIDRVAAGQIIVLKLPEDTVQVEPVELPLEVLYEDEAVLLLNKPPRIAVHPSAGRTEPTVANAVVAHYQKAGSPAAFRPLNRLDRNTSGLLLAAKNAHAAHVLSDARADGRLQKVYYAVALGRLEGSGTIDQPIRIREGSCIAREVGEGGKPSVTHWQALDSDGDITLLRVVIDTGRTHQIRVHMAWLGHPLAGDTLYGTDGMRLPRHALHCAEMDFPHPESGELMRFACPLPDDMAALLKNHGMANPF